MPVYKHGKQKETIDLETFRRWIRKLDGSPQPLRDKSLLAFLYWFGVRKEEALERVKEDFSVKGGIMTVNAPPMKSGERPPLEIPADLPFVNLIIKQVEETKPRQRVWPISPVTAWRIVKKVSERHYPHFFRLNRATQFLNDPEITIPQVKTWFAWKRIETVNKYIGYSKRHIRQMAPRLRNEVEKP